MNRGEKILGNSRVDKYTKEHTKDSDVITTKDSVEKIDKFARKLALKADAMGFHVAARHLRHYLDGKRIPLRPDKKWLRGYKKVKDAETRIRGYFEHEVIKELGKHLCKDNRFSFSAFFDGTIRYNGAGCSNEELFFATGDSDIRSTGHFTVIIEGDWVIVTGKVDHKWWDDYDFDAGKGIMLPGAGSIPDAAMQKLARQGNARPYHLETHWYQTLEAKFQIGTPADGVTWDWGVVY